MSNSINIRPATKADVPAILALVKELAVYEKAPNEVINTEEDMLRDGFGEHLLFKVIIAEDADGIQGMAFYNLTYSTWRGRILYLDDLVVTESARGRGIGKQLLTAIYQAAVDERVNEIRWLVLDWNQPAINFYQSIQAEIDGEWMICKVRKDVIQNFAKTGKLPQ